MTPAGTGMGDAHEIPVAPLTLAQVLLLDGENELENYAAIEGWRKCVANDEAYSSDEMDKEAMPGRVETTSNKHEPCSNGIRPAINSLHKFMTVLTSSADRTASELKGISKEIQGLQCEMEQLDYRIKAVEDCLCPGRAAYKTTAASSRNLRALNSTLPQTETIAATKQRPEEVVHLQSDPPAPIPSRCNVPTKSPHQEQTSPCRSISMKRDVEMHARKSPVYSPERTRESLKRTSDQAGFGHDGPSRRDFRHG